MQKLRDSFLDSVFKKFPEFNQEEIYEVLLELKQPYINIANSSDTLDYAAVSEPWAFNLCAVNQPVVTTNNSAADDNLDVTK